MVRHVKFRYHAMIASVLFPLVAANAPIRDDVEKIQTGSSVFLSTYKGEKGKEDSCIACGTLTMMMNHEI